MASIIRLKRRLEDDQSDAILLNCKRQKRDENEFTTVLTYAGTVNNDEDFYRQLQKLPKEAIENSLKKYTPNLVEKVRLHTKDASKTNRYKITNSFRSLNIENFPLDIPQTVDYTVLEVESEKSAISALPENFVYDIYYTNTEVNLASDIVDSIELFDDLTFSRYRDDVKESSSEESDDSNDENNWRNDYPDSDVDDEDMLRAVKNCHIDDEDGELSSDEDLVFGEAYKADEARFGKMYAQFKAKANHSESDDEACGIDRDFCLDEDAEGTSDNEEYD